MSMQETLSDHERVEAEYEDVRLIYADYTGSGGGPRQSGTRWIVDQDGERTEYVEKRPARVAAKLAHVAGIEPPERLPSSFDPAELDLPLAVVNLGKNGIGAYLYVGFAAGTDPDPYQTSADALDVTKQTAKNYVQRFLDQ